MALRVNGASKDQEYYLPKYLKNFSDVFDTKKAGRLLEQSGFEYAIETEGKVLYRPLYNLSSLQLEALRTYL